MSNHDGSQTAFLLSMPRSGSTLLSLMLGSHPDICCPPEPWIILVLAEYFELGDIRRAPYGRQWAEIAAMEFLLSPERKQRGAVGSALGALRLSAGMDTMASAQKIANTAYQLHLEVSSKRVFIDKTPRYYAVLDLLDKMFPLEKKIVLLRNPLDIFASYKSTWEIQRSIFTPEGVLVHTRDFCEGLFKLADYIANSREDVLVLRYEDLVREPEAKLRSVCEFMGIEFSPGMLRYYENASLLEEYRRSPVGDPISSSQPKLANSVTVNAWAQRLETEDIQALIDVLGINIFERLGYGDTIFRLRSLAVQLPTEEQAASLRASLLRAMIEGVREEPFSVWQDFIFPLRQSQADRAARLNSIHQQQAEVEVLRQALADSELDRAARLDAIHQQQADIEGLCHRLEASEADRIARLDVIQKQQAEVAVLRQALADSELDRAARLEAIHQQQAEVEVLRQALADSELDRAARLEAINQKQADIEGLCHRLETSEADRAARLDVIQKQQAEVAVLRQALADSELDRAARLEAINQQQQDIEGLCHRLETSEADRAARLDAIQEQQLALDALRQRFAISETDRAERLEVINRQQMEMGALWERLHLSEAERRASLDVINAQLSELKRLRSSFGFIVFQLNKLKTRIFEIVKK